MTKRATRFAGVLACLCLLAAAASGSQLQCEETITAEDGFRIREVRVESRWKSLAGVQLPLQPGSVYSPADLLPALEAVREALRREAAHETGKRGFLGVRYIDSCVQIVGDKQVDVIIRPVEVRVDLVSPGANILPTPRSNRPTLPSQAPALLRLFNPGFSLDHDRELGVVERAAFSTDLLAAGTILRGRNPEVRESALVVEGEGQRALNSSFYEARGRFSFSRGGTLRLMQRAAAEGEFEVFRRPQGGGVLLRNSVRLGGSLRLRPSRGPVRGVTVAGSYRRSSNRLDSTPSPQERTAENAIEARSVADARFWGGFSRAGIWFDGGAPEKLPGSYRRVAVLAGYGRELPVRGQQTIGLEAVFGAGRAWGNIPEYARFYGGPGNGNFLYDPADSVPLRALPAGALVRSFGASQAGPGAGMANGPRGGTSYWHFNATVSLPIPKWSYPLIPPEDTGLGVPLNELVRRQGINSARSFLASYYETQEGLPPAEAEKRAEADIRAIEPAVNFLTRHANLYAVKPLVLFDAAGLEGANRQRTVYALGGGLQFTLVVAKFEAAYLRTLRGGGGESRSNFLMRLVFQNLF